VQAVALEEVQVNVGEAPLATGLELAIRVAVGITLTVALVTALVPPAPVHVSK
jgi:hypothetical protein